MIPASGWAQDMETPFPSSANHGLVTLIRNDDWTWVCCNVNKKISAAEIIRVILIRMQSTEVNRFEWLIPWNKFSSALCIRDAVEKFAHSFMKLKTNSRMGRRSPNMPQKAQSRHLHCNTGTLTTTKTQNHLAGHKVHVFNYANVLCSYPHQFR